MKHPGSIGVVSAIMELGYGASGVLKLLIPGRQGIGRVCLVMSNKINYDLLDALTFESIAY